LFPPYSHHAKDIPLEPVVECGYLPQEESFQALKVTPAGDPATVQARKVSLAGDPATIQPRNSSRASDLQTVYSSQEESFQPISRLSSHSKVLRGGFSQIFPESNLPMMPDCENPHNSQNSSGRSPGITMAVKEKYVEAKESKEAEAAYSKAGLKNYVEAKESEKAGTLFRSGAQPLNCVETKELKKAERTILPDKCEPLQAFSGGIQVHEAANKIDWTQTTSFCGFYEFKPENNTVSHTVLDTVSNTTDIQIQNTDTDTAAAAAEEIFKSFQQVFHNLSTSFPHFEKTSDSEKGPDDFTKKETKSNSNLKIQNKKEKTKIFGEGRFTNIDITDLIEKYGEDRVYFFMDYTNYVYNNKPILNHGKLLKKIIEESKIYVKPHYATFRKKKFDERVKILVTCENCGHSGYAILSAGRLNTPQCTNCHTCTTKDLTFVDFRRLM
jgi:hypothetical protein